MVERKASDFMRKNIGFLTGTQSGVCADRSTVTAVANKQIGDLAKPKALTRKKKKKYFRADEQEQKKKTVESLESSCSPSQSFADLTRAPAINDMNSFVISQLKKKDPSLLPELKKSMSR